MKQWMIYTENELKFSYEYRKQCVMNKCWNEWKRMFKNIQLIEKVRYLNLWRQKNGENITKIYKLLNFPTKSRYILLKIISILRMSRITFNRKRYKIILNKLFVKYGIIVLFVFLNTWRTLAQQKNIAAFKIIEIINVSDKNTTINYLRKWRIKTKFCRKKRIISFDRANKLHLTNVYKKCIKQWMTIFYHKSMTKMALFHWAKFMESRVFDKWSYYTN